MTTTGLPATAVLKIGPTGVTASDFQYNLTAMSERNTMTWLAIMFDGETC